MTVMDCPRCAADLDVTQRRGIEIDVCPECRGVWLDRGELDKLILRSADAVVPPVPEPPAIRSSRWLDDEDMRRRGSRRSFLSEYFDG
jgi:Zn-finger nucleic acid-binding protein